jgi:hypothetical protein
MSGTPEEASIPEMPPAKAQVIARGLKWRAQSYVEAGMTRETTRAERDSQWWMTSSIPLSQTHPDTGS